MTSINLVSSLIQCLGEETFNLKLTPPKTEVHRLTLDNDMDILLIYNSAFKNSEAMLTVDAGSIYDPDGIPGLAHLVEHLILRKSEDKDSDSKFINEFKNLLLAYCGKFHSLTDSEKITFHLMIRDALFKKALTLLSKLIANPVFTNSLCFKEIEFIESEVNINDLNPMKKILKFIEFFNDDKIQETRSINGNKKTLNIDNIIEEAQEFYSRYFKANRMKLVIKSKLPIKELKKFIEVFNCFPKDDQTSNLFHIKKKMKKNSSNSILDYSENTKLKKEFRGEIIKFQDKNHKPLVYFYFRFPSNFKGLTSIHLDYIKEYISQYFKEHINQNEFFKNIRTFHQISRRKKDFFIIAESKKNDDKIKNILISFIYEFIKSIRPDKNFFEEVKNKTIAKYEQNTDHYNIIQTYSENLFLNSTSKLGEFEKSVEFDEKVFEDLFKFFADINNWIVFVPTSNSKLPKSIPDFPCAFSNPVPIRLETSIQGVFMNSNQIEFKKITDMKVDDVMTNLSLLPKHSLLVNHKKLSNGEYTILNESRVFGEFCEVILNFISPAKKFENFSNEIFTYAILRKIQNNCIEYKIDCELKIIFNNLFDNNLSVKLKREDLPEFFEILKKQLTSYKLTKLEIDDAKSILMQNYITVQESGLSDLLKLRLPYIIKQVDFNFEIDDNYPIKFNEDYYLMITAIGNINEKDVFKIYRQLSSTCKREIFDGLNLNGETFCISSPDPTDKSFIIAYHLAAESKLKEFTLANLLKVILSFCLNLIMEEKFGVSCELQVDYTYIRQKVFLTFAIKTSIDSTLIKDELIKAIKSYSEIISKISEKNLDIFKESAFKILKWKMNKEERITSFALLMTLIGIYDVNFQALVIESIYSIDIEELRKLQDSFSVEPFIITGSNEL